ACDLLAVRTPGGPWKIARLAIYDGLGAVRIRDHQLSHGAPLVVANLGIFENPAVEDLAAIRRKSASHFVVVRRVGEVAPVRAVGPHQEQVPITLITVGG